MKILSFDLETDGFAWWGDELGFLATTADAKREYAFDLTGEQVEIESYIGQLKDAEVLVAHNAKYDVHETLATVGLDILTLDAELHCTDLMARIFWPEGSYGEHNGFGLKNLARHYIDPEADLEEKELKAAGKAIGYRTLNKPGAYRDVWRAYPKVLERYALKDARYAYDLFVKLYGEYEAAKAAGDGRARIYDLERQVLPLLIRAERVGVAVHPQTVANLRAQYKAEERRLYDELSKRWGEKALGGEGSEEALQEALLAEGIPLTERTESGKLATSMYALRPFENSHPIVRTYLDYRHTEKFLSTYIEPMIGKSVVHTSFQQCGPWTGRMACRSPNLQNIPVRSGPEIRDVFIPRPGYKLIVADYDTIEIRILAYYLGTEGAAFRELINEGMDLHSWMAAQLANRNIDPWSSAGSDPADFAKDGPNSKLRALAKSTLFAIVYGAGGCKLCEMLNLDTGPPLRDSDWVVQRGYKAAGQPSCAKGQEVAKAVKGSIPGYAKLMKRVRQKIEAHGYVTTIGGRRQAIAKDKGYVGMSGLIQGSAADCMKQGLVYAVPGIEAWGGRLLLVVHDEVVAEAPEADAAQALGALQAGLENAGYVYALDPPLLTSGAIADSYGQAK